ncbi:MAG TPA: cytochrome c biogenesis protein CcsA [Planctomycetota bacterium]|jgi:cytochrome c-type biogenesis protein CcsB|nr:cytochrome c biogenesis protein CcsA [Planctomycetota bacterium]
MTADRLFDATFWICVAGAPVALAASLGHFLSGGGGRLGRLARGASLAALLLGLAATLADGASLGHRWHETGHWPSQTLFEVIQFATFVLLVCFWIVFGVLRLHAYRGGLRGLTDLILFVLLAGIAGTAVYVRGVVNRAPDTLPPALQSYWFPPHISSLMVSYATLTIAYVACLVYFSFRFARGLFERNVGRARMLAIGSFLFFPWFQAVVNVPVALICIGVAAVLYRTKKGMGWLDSWMGGFDDFSFRIFSIGFPFLTAGFFMGSFWAQEAWATYWGWDSKEVSAFITWLIYLLYLHLRFVGGLRGEKTMALLALGGVSIFITFQLFGYLPESQESLHKYTEGSGAAREGLLGEAGGEAPAPPGGG